MKYLESFFSQNYKPGDYILIKLIKMAGRTINLFKYARILKITSQSTYEIDGFIDDINTNLFLHNNRIERKLNAEEIKEFELKKASTKYNL